MRLTGRSVGGRRTLSGALAASAILMSCGCAFFAPAAGPEPARGEAFQDLGPAVETLGVSGTAFFRDSAGDLLLSFATHNEDPIRVAVYNVTRDRMARVLPLPLGMTAWGMAELGGKVYLGAYKGIPAPPRSILYALDPATGDLSQAAEFPGGPLIWDMAAADGKLLIGADPDALLFEYDPAAGALRRIAAAAPGENFVRSVAAWSDRTLLAGLGSRAELAEVDIADGTVRTLTVPPLAGESIVYDMAAAAGKAFLGTEPGGKFVVWDGAARGVEAALDTGGSCVDLVRFDGEKSVFLTTRPTGRLLEYRIDDRTMAEVGTPVLQSGATRGLYADKDQVVGLAANACLWRYDRLKRTFRTRDLRSAALPGASGYPMALAVGPDGRVYVGGHWTVAVVDPKTGRKKQHPFPGEPKAMAARGGVLWIASYPGARLWKYLPSVRWRIRGLPDDNPVCVGGLEAHGQNRPWAALASTDGLFLGTSPEYGQMGGALAVFTPSTGAWKVFREPIPSQSVYSLATEGNQVFGGTSILGGEGTTPLAKEAAVFIWNAATGNKTGVITPVPGQAAIYGLAFAGGRLYGLTNGGYLFRIDPRSGDTEAVKAFESAGFSYFHLKPHLVALADGSLLGTTGDSLFRVPAGSLTARILRRDETGYVAVRGRDVFLTIGKNLFRYRPE